MSSVGVDGRDDLSVIDTGEDILVAEKQPVYIGSGAEFLGIGN